jgi:hypothetical protein
MIKFAPLQEALNEPFRAPADARTGSGRPFPTPSGFSESTVTTAAARVFPSLSPGFHGRLIDLERFAANCPPGRHLAGAAGGEIAATVEAVLTCNDLQNSRKAPAAARGGGRKSGNRHDKMCQVRRAGRVISEWHPCGGGWGRSHGPDSRWHTAIRPRLLERRLGESTARRSWARNGPSE